MLVLEGQTALVVRMFQISAFTLASQKKTC